MKTTTNPPPAETPPPVLPLAPANATPPPAPANATPPPSASDASAAPLALKEHHRATFTQARDTIAAQYGVTPTSDELMRLWITSAAPWHVVRVFEETVLNITGSDLAGTDDEQFVLCL